MALVCVALPRASVSHEHTRHEKEKRRKKANRSRSHSHRLSQRPRDAHQPSPSTALHGIRRRRSTPVNSSRFPGALPLLPNVCRTAGELTAVATRAPPALRSACLAPCTCHLFPVCIVLNSALLPLAMPTLRPSLTLFLFGGTIDRTTRHARPRVCRQVTLGGT